LFVEPTPEQVERGAAALFPFVQEWGLSLNPEDLDELAYAVLRHHDTSTTWDQLDAEVRAQLVEWSERREATERAYRDADPN
jgi:hypothetical protein